MSLNTSYDMTNAITIRPSIDHYKSILVGVKLIDHLYLRLWLIEIIRDIYCIWRQPFCSNPSIVPGIDLYTGCGLTKSGALEMEKTLNNFKNHPNVYNDLLKIAQNNQYN